MGDVLDSVIIECYEGGSEVLIGSCQTSLGVLASSRSVMCLLTNSDLLGTWPFTIQTTRDRLGYSMGRCHTIRARSSTQCRAWVKSISESADKAQKSARYKNRTSLQKLCLKTQDVMRLVNNSPLFIGMVYLAIMISFVVSIIQTEVIPRRPDVSDPRYQDLLITSKIVDVIELSITVTFSIDLLVNLVANWFQPFFADRFNYLDMFVVAISWVALSGTSFEGSTGGGSTPGTSAMRMIRMFRLIRIFKLSRVFVEVGSYLLIPCPFMNSFVDARNCC